MSRSSTGYCLLVANPFTVPVRQVAAFMPGRPADRLVVATGSSCFWRRPVLNAVCSGLPIRVGPSQDQ